MNKKGLDDKRLSFKAKGILAYLLSKPDNWKANITHLSKVSKDGRGSIRTGLQELEEYGYLTRRPIRNEDGTIKEWESIICEIPTTSPHVNYQHVDNQHVDNCTLISNDSNNYNNNNKGKLFDTNITNFKKAFGQAPNYFQKEKLINLNEKLLNYIIKWAGEKGKRIEYFMKVIDDVIKSNICTSKQFVEHIEERKNNKGYNSHTKNKPFKKERRTSNKELEDLYKTGYK
jgi:hypothetical protein